MIDSNPPFFAAYGSLFHSRPAAGTHEAEAVEECDLPLVDLSRLSDKLQAEQCKREIVTAASVWGFFQIVNHGIPNCVLDRLREEQVRVFRQPFKKKADEKFLGSLGDSYRWGAPTATSLKQLSWLEAYHIPLSSATYPVTTSPSSIHYIGSRFPINIISSEIILLIGLCFGDIWASSGVFFRYVWIYRGNRFGPVGLIIF
ncbi:gibberellin 2-beta-dioxygenase [Musa troglodytarum]|uniref:Gibberellin 2-beta-dioxygenase n=1 Tax=Musa troglodytarum TaxID=320322 RepID=A0A9E7KSJ3_9LILI|nr:gibberellin 2-beta-dioxygenase [Musa troglodytarum]